MNNKIGLTKGQVTTVPEELLDFLQRYSWHAAKDDNTFYAIRGPRQNEDMKGKSRRIAMHRVIWEYYNGNIPDGMVIAHIDGNGLNNILENLRCVTPSDRSKNHSICKNNKSGCTGVKWEQRRSKWIAYISIKSKLTRIYYGDSKEDAIAARKAAEIEHYGEFVRQE